MYKHILVAAAFHADETEKLALEAARALAGATAKVTVLHVRETIPASVANYLPADHIARLRAEMMTTLEEIAAGFDQGHAVLVDGHAGRTIVEWADANGVDCIVLASHRPEFQDYLLGSTAGRVVRHANCSVHVVR